MHSKSLAWGMACAVVSAPALLAQEVVEKVWTAGPTGSSFTWRTTANWSPSGVPNAADTLIRFNDTSNHVGGTGAGAGETRIGVSASGSTAENPGTLSVGAIVLEASNTVDRYIRNNTSAPSSLNFTIHGLEENGSRLLLANYSLSNTLRFHQSSGNNEVQLTNVYFANSGVIHVENPDARIWFTTRIFEPEAAGVELTKTGAGILQFGIDSGSHASVVGRNHLTGGLVVEGGIVRTSISSTTSGGNINTSPFGFGAVTMRGGALQSTSTDSRNIDNALVLDGNVAFGSAAAAFNGNLVFRSNANQTTTVASDSEVTVYNTTTINQNLSGSGGLLLSGPGTLVLGGDVSYDGMTTLSEGTLRVNNATIAGDVAVQAGGTLAFGTATAVGQGTFGAALALDEGGFLSFRLNGLDSFDSMLANGAVSLDGAILDIDLGFTPDFNDVFLLIDNQSGQALNGLLSYGGNTLAEGSEFTVTTGVLSQVFEITYLAGDGNSLALTAIPEPSTWALLSGLAVLGVAGWRRRK